MLGTKPPLDSVNPPYNLAAATTEMMWACALASARVTVASTARGLALWSRMLRAPVGPAPWSILAGQSSGAPDGEATPNRESASASLVAAGEPAAFASYRSPGGHAAAQVTVAQ